MKIDSQRIKKILEQRLDNGQRIFKFDKEKDTLRIEDKELKRGVTLSLAGIVGKYQKEQDRAIDEVIYYVEETFHAMKKSWQSIEGEKIFPVIRATSFPTKDKEGHAFLTDEHTAETRIYYVLDMGNSYRLLNETVLEEMSHEQIQQLATKNLRQLKTVVKQDEVGGNVFYFFRTNDGYDASRLLNSELLQGYENKISGTMVVAVPHQDVLIIADLRNEKGYDILAQMNMSFFTNGLIPITALSFLYEQGKLEPIFILGKKG